MKDKIKHILETADFANWRAQEECERRLQVALMGRQILSHYESSIDDERAAARAAVETGGLSLADYVKTYGGMG